MSEKKAVVGGGSRAAKKRRKDIGSKTEQGNVGEISKGGGEQAPSMTIKKPKFSADTLSRAALELVDTSVAASSSSGTKAKSQSDLLKLSIKEVLALEDVVEVSSQTRAAAVLNIILAPYDRVLFYSDYWEKRPMHCANDVDKKKNVRGLLSSKQFRHVIKSHSILYDLDVTASNRKIKYSADSSADADDGNNEEDEEEEEEELIEAKEAELWASFRDGFSVRLLCPQKFHDPLWALLSLLEFEFGSRVGCSVDFMPPNGKGFKARYDNFDSLVVQLEGQSKWKL